MRSICHTSHHSHGATIDFVPITAILLRLTRYSRCPHPHAALSNRLHSKYDTVSATHSSPPSPLPMKCVNPCFSTQSIFIRTCSLQIAPTFTMFAVPGDHLLSTSYGRRITSSSGHMSPTAATNSSALGLPIRPSHFHFGTSLTLSCTEVRPAEEDEYHDRRRNSLRAVCG